MKDSTSRAEDLPTRGKRYTPPVLTEYGSVSKLTMAKGGSFVESPSAKKSTSCL